jgi:Zn-dependent protease
MKTSVKIGSAWGIPIELHITFILLMIAVFVLTYPSLYYFILILFLFVFVVVHELSHSLVARHYNIKVRKIVLYPIGGVSEIEEIPENPRIEWRMAIAGPLSSVLIGLVFLGVNYIVPTEMADTLYGSFALDLAILNIFLGAFNLIPAFPMDGGRVFRALLAEHMKFSDATRYAAMIGRFFGILLVFVGLFYNLWLIVIGVFIYIGATEEAETTVISTSMAGIRVKDVMFPEAAVVRPEASLAEALEVMLKARYHDILIEKDGVLQGIVTWDEVMKVKPDRRAALRVEEMPMKQISAFSDESVLEVYKIMTREKIDLVPIVDKANPSKVIGVVTNESVSSAIEKSKTPR